MSITKLALEKLLFKNLRSLWPVQKDIPVDTKVTQKTDAKGAVTVDVQTTDGNVYMPKDWATSIAKAIAESLYDKLVGTQPDGAVCYISTPVFTPLVTGGVHVKLLGTYKSGLSKNFEVSSDGRITYKGSATKWFVARLIFSGDSGSTDEYHFAFSKNGTMVTDSEQHHTMAGASTIHLISLVDRFELKQNDYLEVTAAADGSNPLGGITPDHFTLVVE